MVTRLVATRRPDEVVHVYDHDWRPTARTKLYAGYKADRPPEPEDLTAQFVLLRGCSRRWEHAGPRDGLGGGGRDRRPVRQGAAGDRFEIVSGDRDLLQLVHDPEVRLLFTVRGVSELREFDEAEVLETYGVRARYAEFAILRGILRRSARSPVGEKTARALVRTYPDIDAMLADAARDHRRRARCVDLPRPLEAA